MSEQHDFFVVNTKNNIWAKAKQNKAPFYLSLLSYFLSSSQPLSLSHDVRADGPCRPVEAHELAQRRGQFADELVVLGEVQAAEHERDDALGHEGVVGVADELALACLIGVAKGKTQRARGGRGGGVQQTKEMEDGAQPDEKKQNKRASSA